ncbi:penicillin-binding transpeptidase domain-containing protein [Engelhardtia mirabilis]|uniref:beta-lactamase n=1 Tax=Engelhardtia mirabilis TaxID=2528011 RepID=A0A518BPY6_9BACT|nr:Peptidoglycan synthase FtsI precursor [Planctomycetes bacterium Pla133]QDV03354.1 Peptidoglycan synthase FtsI precursor [Planctomycetes bacterium Pla86]
MGFRRTRPLIVLLLLGWVVLVVRLGQVQLGEHQVWAEEAAKLERSGEVLLYERGSIRDTNGRVLVEDQAIYHLELRYRDFRRAHPVGLVAHARSAIEQRAVSLPEAAATLDAWATELVRLSPGDLHRFARGAGLRVGGFVIDGVDQPWVDRRPGRASDLRFYARSLLEPDSVERRALVKLERKPEIDQSYLELVAGLRGVAPEVLLDEQRVRWRRSLDSLELLAERLRASGNGTGTIDLDAGAEPLDAILAQLEEWRRQVESSAAAVLFRDVVGFEIGRLEPHLAARLDLDWLARELGWRQGRIEQWYRSERAMWLEGWRDGYALPRLLAELRLVEDPAPSADRALSLLAAVYGEPQALADALDGAPRNWRAFDRPEVLSDVPWCFDLDVPRGWRPPEGVAFAPRAPRFLGELRGRAAPWSLLDELTDHPRRAALLSQLTIDDPRAFSGIADGDLGALWARVAPSFRGRDRERVLLLARALLDSLEAHLQARLGEVFDALVELDPDGDGRLAPSEEGLDRIGERARNVLRDYGTRRALLHRQPEYEVVYLLTRDPASYPGLIARPERERRRVVLEGEDAVPAEHLLGDVSAMDPQAAQAQRAAYFELQELRRLGSRTDEQQGRLQTLMRELLMHDEARGVSGVEAMTDPWLAGHNGYRERLGLEDVFGRGAESIFLTDVVDGHDVWLTIDDDLQRAAQSVIDFPDLPDDPPDELADLGWFDQPVGAIVLARPNGDLLATASAPSRQELVGPDAEGQRAVVMDRALRMPGFQPIGSVFKPFVAVYVLDRLEQSGIDEHFVHDCAPDEEVSHAGWGGVRCHSRWGHGVLDMAGAIAVSCNSYFARLADELTTAQVEQVGADFGFGQPTGVRFEGSSPGLAEDVPEDFQWSATSSAGLRRELRRACNGLSVVDVTPVQVARAVAGLATGVLPSMQLIQRVGDEAVSRGPVRELPYGEASFDKVRAMMELVTNDAGGSAYKTLRHEVLGWTVAAKTGSADLQSRKNVEGADVSYKHTWVAGWLPAEDPQLVFVVFLNGTTSTSSHGAIYVARQILQRPELREWMEAEGFPAQVNR